MKYFFTGLALFSALTLSVYAQAPAQPLSQQPEAEEGYLIVCDGPEAGGDYGDTDAVCDINALKDLLAKGFNFVIFIAIFISIASFMYAGFLYLTSNDHRDETKKAKDIMKKSIIGIIVILIAWIAVYTVLDLLGVKEGYNYLEE